MKRTLLALFVVAIAALFAIALPDGATADTGPPVVTAAIDVAAPVPIVDQLIATENFEVSYAIPYERVDLVEPSSRELEHQLGLRPKLSPAVDMERWRRPPARAVRST